MGSNNEAAVITDPTKTRQVLAEFEGLAARGASFKVLGFNPDLDRFAISPGRESNLLTLQNVEMEGAVLDAPIAKGSVKPPGDGNSLLARLGAALLAGGGWLYPGGAR